MIYAKDKIILVDCDGVLLDWIFAFERYQETKGLKLADPSVYNVAKRYNTSLEQGLIDIQTFNDSAAIGFLPPLMDAVYYVRRLYMKHGYRFHVISSVSLDPHAHRLRIMNLEMLFGKDVFDGFTFEACGASKTKALSKWEGSECYWIEDLHDNAEEGEKFGLDPLLVAHPWNADSQYPRFPKWKNIYRHIVDA